MEIPFLGAKRSEWKTSNRLEFYKRIEPLFKTLDHQDKAEIKQRLLEEDPDFFELPIYANKHDDEPSVIVMFEADKIFIDFIEPDKKSIWLEKIQNLIGNAAEPVKWRDLTKKDWLKRLDVLDSLTPF